MDNNSLIAILIVVVSLLTGYLVWRETMRRKDEKAVKDQERVKLESLPLAADLDAIIVKPYAFRLMGQVHTIQPMEVVKFIEVTESIAKLDALKSEKVSAAQLLSAYEELFTRACPTVTRAVLEKMSYPQIAALLNLVLEYIMGKAHIEAEKKSQPLDASQSHA